MTDDSMRNNIYDHDVVNTSGYTVRDALEVDWSKGKSWREHMKEKGEPVVLKARVKFAHVED